MRTRYRSSITAGVGVLLLLAAACGGSRAARGVSSEEGLRHYRQGLLLFEQKRFQESIKEFESAVKEAPGSADYRYRLGFVHYSLGEWAKAESALREAVRLDSYYSDARLLLGAVLSEQGRKGEALREFRGVLDDRSYATPERVWVNIALLHEQAGNFDEAVTSYRQALDARPRYARAHYGLAQVLDRLGRLEEALGEYEIAEAEYRDNPEFHYRLGVAYFRAGKPARAKEHLDLVVRKAPGSTDAARAQDLLKLIP